MFGRQKFESVFAMVLCLSASLYLSVGCDEPAPSDQHTEWDLGQVGVFHYYAPGSEPHIEDPNMVTLETDTFKVTFPASMLETVLGLILNGATAGGLQGLLPPGSVTPTGPGTPSTPPPVDPAPIIAMLDHLPEGSTIVFEPTKEYLEYLEKIKKQPQRKPSSGKVSSQTTSY